MNAGSPTRKQGQIESLHARRLRIGCLLLPILSEALLRGRVLFVVELLQRVSIRDMALAHRLIVVAERAAEGIGRSPGDRAPATEPTYGMNFVTSRTAWRARMPMPSDVATSLNRSAVIGWP